jgi:23S rRNA pseudoU1915 N3-methylase RlmH
VPAPAIVELEEKRRLPAAELKMREAELILAAVPADARLVALDQRGKEWSSLDLADRLRAWRDAEPARSPSQSAAPRGWGPRSSTGLTQCYR